MGNKLKEINYSTTHKFMTSESIWDYCKPVPSVTEWVAFTFTPRSFPVQLYAYLLASEELHYNCFSLAQAYLSGGNERALRAAVIV